VSKIQQDIANDDVNGFYRTLEGQRLARKNARKNKKRKNNEGSYIWTWDDDYDPLHPNEYDTYVDSDEQLREQIEWKRKLDGKSEEDEQEEGRGYRGFAPPPEEYGEGEWDEEEETVDDGREYVPEPVAVVELDETADDVYARRLRMAQEAGKKVRDATPPAAAPPPPVVVDDEEFDGVEIIENPKERDSIKIISKEFSVRSEPPDQTTPIQQQYQYPPISSYPQPPSFYDDAPGMQPTHAAPPSSTATISSEPIHYSTATISSDPVFYDPPNTNLPATTNPSEPRASHPGQKDFASRLMSKYGWQKGQSLGTTASSGLVVPLVMKADKDRKGTGVILNRNKAHEDYGPRGKMTRCIVLCNVVGIGEVDEELVDEIGGECREKYGEVERVRVVEEAEREREEERVRVYVLFTSELSALRGVNALDGRLFGGRT
jgi:splicing factor 45